MPHSATQAARSGERGRAFVKLRRPSNLTPDPRPGTSLWRRRAIHRQMVGEPLYQMAEEQLDQMPRESLDEMARVPRASGWLRALLFTARIVFFPLRRPFRFIGIALAAMLLYYAARGSVSLGQQVLGYFDVVASIRRSADSAMSSLSSLVNEEILGRSKQAPAPPATPASIPSPASPSSPTP